MLFFFKVGKIFNPHLTHLTHLTHLIYITSININLS